MEFKKLLLIIFFEICFLLASILQAQENSPSLIEQNKVITVEEYALFLSECALSDPYHLYEAEENFIIRFGTVGEYQYSFLPEESQKPVTLLSTLDAIRYDHWKHHQNEKLGDALEVIEQGIHSLQGEEIIPINNKNSSCLTMDRFLKTNLCDFCFLRKEEHLFQSTEDLEGKTLIGLTCLLFLASGLKAQNAIQLQYPRAGEVCQPISESSSRKTDAATNPLPKRDTALDIFCKYYTRHNEISKKIKEENDRYVKERQIITSLLEPRRSLCLLQEESKHTNILLVLKEAQRYQNFLHCAATKAPHRKTAIERTIILANHPNRLELLTEEIGRDEDQLALYQQNYKQTKNILERLDKRPSALLSEEDQTLQQKARTALTYLNQAIKNRILARDRIIALIQELPSHYEKDIKEVVSLLKTRALPILEARVSAISSYKAFLSTPPISQQKIKHLENAAFRFSKAVAEAKQSNPNQLAIQKYIRSAGFSEQAVVTYNYNQHKAALLGNAALSLAKAAAEEQKPNPYQQIIKNYIRTAELFEQAAQTWDHHPEKAAILNSASVSLAKAAAEEQKPTPNRLVIQKYIRSSEVFKQAVQTWDHHPEKAADLYKAGVSLYDAAEKEQRPNPYQEEIDRFFNTTTLLEYGTGIIFHLRNFFLRETS